MNDGEKRFNPNFGWERSLKQLKDTDNVIYGVNCTLGFSTMLRHVRTYESNFNMFIVEEIK